ncbi:MAG: RraA family protein [Gemmataceae bacterium]|nr:RraA family protein [Gemmataceae bacterium]
MTLEILSKEELALLRKFDTPTVCNVVELCDLRPWTAGYMDRRIAACYPKLPPMVGYASTATFRAGAPPRGGNVYGGMSAQLEDFRKLPGPPVVVFQDLDDPSTAATFGEIMCTTYKTFGAVGLITSGTGRDLDQVATLNFPVFTGGTVCAHGYCQILDVGVTVHIGGVTIHPGDIIHADLNGVTTIPHGIAAKVARACQEFMDAEAVILDYLKKPNPTVERFNQARDESKKLIQALAKKLKGE